MGITRVEARSKMSKSCFCLIPEAIGPRHYSPVLSQSLEHTLTHGIKISDVVVEKPLLSVDCELVRELSPPVLNLGEEGQYFRPDTTYSSTRRRSASSGQLLLVSPSDGQDLSTHLLYACVHGHSNALQLLLNESSSIDLNSPLTQPGSNEQGLTPLSWAALYNNSTVCKLLVSKGAGVDVRDSLGRTALHWAVMRGWLNSVKTLLKLAASPSVTDEKGLTPLHYASVLGLQEVAAALLKEAISLVAVPHQPTGSTPLLLACYHGHTNTVKLLLKNRASVHLANDQRLTPLHCSVWSGNVKCVKTVLSSAGREAVGVRDSLGRTPLHTAALKGDSSLCQLLLKRGAQLGSVDSERRTLLHWAVLSGQLLCAEYVISLDGDLVNQADCQGATPLHYAASRASNDITEFLVSKGADPTFPDAKGHAPLVWASSFARESNIRCLLVHESNKRGPLEAIHAGASVGAVDVCQLLTEHDKECVDAVSSEGYTALHYASRFGHTACVELLLSRGASVDHFSKQQETSLHLACTGGHAQTVNCLLSGGADQSTPLSKQWAVHIASSGGHADVLEVLINDDTRVVNQPASDEGHTPLHLAASHGYLECCRLLVSRGCNKTLTLSTQHKYTALDLAMLGDHMGCVDYLISVGVPTGGGVFHRAAATIQAVWRYHRYKRRVGVCREWCAVVIQRAVRQWLRRRAADRVRWARLRHRDHAARVVQRQWRVFISLKRRYEASCAQLRARLQQETLATSLILSQLHLSAQSVSLPPPLPTTSQHGPSAKYLLKASSNPAPIFLSGSLLFPAKPRTPLTSRTLPSRVSRPCQRSRSLLASRSPHTNKSRAREVVGGRLQPISSLPSQQVCNGEPVMSRGLPSQAEPDGGDSPTNVDRVGTSRGPPVQPATSVQLASSSSSVEKLPKLPTQTNLVSMPCSEEGSTIEQASPKKPSIKLPSQAQLKLTRRSTFTSILLTTAPLVSQQTLEVDPPQLSEPSPGPPTEPSPGPPTESRRDSPSPQSGVDDDVVLNSVQRYDKLNQILSLLHQARDGDSKEQEVVKLSRLREQIMGALDEAVRLRADTEALQQKANHHSSTSNVKP